MRDVLEGSADTDREGPGEDRSLADGRHLDLRRERKPTGEQLPDRLEEQVAVRADPAPDLAVGRPAVYRGV